MGIRNDGQARARADTIRELAEKLAVAPDELENTVNVFNAACGEGEFDPARLDGKRTHGIDPPKSNWANPIANPPFYGFPMTTHLTFTFGGIKTDTQPGY